MPQSRRPIRVEQSVAQGGRVGPAERFRHTGKSFALLTVGLVMVGAVAWPFAKAHMQAVAVLRLVGGQPVPWIIRKTVAEPVRTKDIQFASAAGLVKGRVYLPERHPDAPGLVVLHGVHHLGIEEPRLGALQQRWRVAV